MKTPFLFSPDNVRGVLETLPSVAGLLSDPGEEGVPSEAWPDALRKTDREVYRWLANTHYSHLADAVGHLERVHDAGCTFGDLLTTRSREQFASRTAEVLIADDLLDRGYGVSTFERSGESLPDLLVKGDGIDVAVEVYSPRELLAVDAWVDDLKDLLMNSDIRADYNFSIDTTIERAIPPSHEQFDPWGPSKFLEQTGEEVFEEIRSDVASALADLRPLDKVYPHPGTPLLTAVTIEDVTEGSEEGPARNGSLSYPGFGGYSPAGVFRTIVERAQKKARKRQAEGADATASALVVYLMGTKIAEDLLHPAHLSGAEEALEEIDPTEYGLDVIAFPVRALPRGLASVLTVGDDATLSVAAVQAMFGQVTPT